jgi:hypothetical protein
LLLGSAPVLAHDGSGGSNEREATTATRQAEVKSNIADAKERLADTKLKVCQLHEQIINNRMQRTAQRGARHLERMGTLAERIEVFATKSGKTVANYDALVADVSAKKTAAQAAVDKVKSDSASFKCDGSDPKGLGVAFKADVKAQAQALKDYKSSIQNLLKAVKTATATSESTGGSQ